MKRILHIDDEPEIREILADCLTAEGYEMHSAASAIEALETIKRITPGLIICDLQLNQSDGLQAIDQLRVSLPDVPVILLTGVLLPPRVAQETMQQRRLVYLEKTNPLKRILDEIRRLLP